MNQNGKMTDELQHIVINICKDGIEVKIVTDALQEALASYQWFYQEATKRQKRDISKQVTNALTIVQEQLRMLGQVSLIEKLNDVFYEPEVGLNKDNIVTMATKGMREKCIKYTRSIQIKIPSKKKINLSLPIGISSSRYKNEFARRMKIAFIEWCEEYPLDEPPKHYDNDFEPDIY